MKDLTRIFLLNLLMFEKTALAKLIDYVLLNL